MSGEIGNRAQGSPRHARLYAGHPRLWTSEGKDVDGRDKPGHDKKTIKAAIRLTQP